MKNNNYVLWAARIIVGLTFIFSGFVKAVDPVGGMIKIEDYFIAFNWNFFLPLALPLAIMLFAMEFIIGFSLITGIWSRLMSWLLALMMAFFTIQTFILAIWNPVSDCGCFGDAIKLTNWQTFYKNVILDIFTIIIFVSRLKIHPVFLKKAQWITFLIPLFIVLSISHYSFRNDPVIDFRPYKVGTDINDLISLPENAKPDIWKSTLVYKNTKTGEIKEFSDDNIPTDLVWQWMETKNNLVQKGDEPKVNNFKIFKTDGTEFTDSFLQDKGYKIVIIQHRLAETNTKKQPMLNDFVSQISLNKDVTVYAFTSSLESEINNFISSNKVPYKFYQMDIIPLQTMIRVNPGIFLIKGTKIINKWSIFKLPEPAEVEKMLYK